MRVHLRLPKATYPACGSRSVPQAYLVSVESYLNTPLLKRCQRCAQSVEGESMIRRAQHVKP